VFNSLVAAARKEGTDVKIIAPKIGGATTSDGKLIPADFKIDGGPSVLFDAVAVVSSPAGTAQLSTEKTALDFVSDAFAHCKFVAFNADAKPLFDAAGIGNKLDEGFIPVASAADANNFITACRAVRLWAREPKVHMAPTP
jgi:catalase